MTQQPRTPTTRSTRPYTGPHTPQANGKCRHRWANRLVREVDCGYPAGYIAARADLLAQIEKAVRGEIDAAPGLDSPGGYQGSMIGRDYIEDRILSRIAAVRSAAPVEPVTHDEIATLAVAAAAASSLAAPQPTAEDAP